MNKALLAKIEKSDADIANEVKKATKAATWINRGKAFYEVAIEPTKSLFVNMDAAMLKLAVGEPKSSLRRRSTVRSSTHGLSLLTAYVKDNKVATWKQTKWVMKDAPAKRPSQDLQQSLRAGPQDGRLKQQGRG